jgi:hypothetical protein
VTLPDNDTLAKLAADATPGPWTTFNATDVFPDDNDTSGENHIADCDMAADFDTHEIISNARLIALAPSLAAEVIALRKRVEAADAMAEALEASYSFIFDEYYQSNRDDGHCLSPESRPTVDVITTALAAYRATGAA